MLRCPAGGGRLPTNRMKPKGVIWPGNASMHIFTLSHLAHTVFPLLLLIRIGVSMPGSSTNFKISPKPCMGNTYAGTCMFVWECIKSEGQHVGVCMDTFMFGSCCAHNLTDNVIMPQTGVHRPTMAFYSSSNNKYKPSASMTSHLSSSGTTTIHRPHGAGTIVIRPSATQRPYPFHRPLPSAVAIGTVPKLPIVMDNTVSDLDTSASISTGMWNDAQPPTIQWHVTTQPNFITKPKQPQPNDNKITPSWNKPKSTKKPIMMHTTEAPPTILLLDNNDFHSYSSSNKPTPISKPKPQMYFKPTKPVTTTTSKISTSKFSTTTSTTTTSSTTTRPTSTTSTTTQTPPIDFSTTRTQAPSTMTGPTSTSSKISETDALQALSSSGATTSTTTSVDSNDILDHISRDTLSAASGIECGISSMGGRPETRIVGGKNAPFGRWPWQVSVRRTSFFGFSSTHRCGGAVINEHWIATAGHCVDDLLNSQIRIRVGEYDFSHVQEQLPYIERAVEKKVVHPKYNFFTYEYDLALVKLEAALEFAPHISPICLPAKDELLVGENATVTGWGRLSEGGTLPSVLQEVLVPIVSNDRCKTMFLQAGRNEFIPDIFLCAGHETGGQDSCQGDSGGPLQVKGKDGHYFLAGIISWGIGCAEANLPGVCTRISKFTPWILENVL